MDGRDDDKPSSLSEALVMLRRLQRDLNAERRKTHFLETMKEAQKEERKRVETEFRDREKKLHDRAVALGGALQALLDKHAILQVDLAAAMSSAKEFQRQLTEKEREAETLRQLVHLHRPGIVDGSQAFTALASPGRRALSAAAALVARAAEPGGATGDPVPLLVDASFATGEQGGAPCSIAEEWFWRDLATPEVLALSRPPPTYPLGVGNVAPPTLSALDKAEAAAARLAAVGCGHGGQEDGIGLEKGSNGEGDELRTERGRTAKLMQERDEQQAKARAAINTLTAQVRRQRKYLIGAVRRIKWLLDCQAKLQGEVDEKGRYVAVLESKLLRLTTRLVAQERLRRQRQQQHAQQQSLPHQAQQGRQPSEARSHSRSPQCASDTVTPSSAPTPSPIASSSGHAPPAARPPAIAMPATATHEAWDAGGDTVDMLDLDELLRAAYRTLGGSGGLKATAGTPAAGGEDGDITPRDSAGGAPESGGEGNGVELGKEGGSGMADQRKPSTEVSPRAPRRSCPLSMHADVGGSNGAAVAALSVETNAAVAPAATASSSGGTASHDADVLTGAGRLARPGSLRAMPQPRLAWLDPADTATSPRSRSAAVAGGGGEGGAHGSGSRGVAGSSAHVVWADAAVERMVLAVGTNRALSSSVADNSEGDADEGEEAGELVECSDGGGDGEDGAVGHAVSVLRAARDGFGAEHRTTARGTAGDSSGATLSPAGPVPTRDRGSPPLGPPACNNMLVPPSPQHAPTLKSTRDSTGPPPTSLLAPTPSPQHPTVVRSPARAQCSPVTDPCGGTTAPSAPVRPAMLRPTPPSPVLPAGQAPSAAGAARPQLLSPAHSSASPTNTSQSSQGGAPTPLRSVRRHGDLFNVGHAIPPLAIAKFSARSAFPGTDNPGVRGSGQSRLNVAEDHTLALGLSRDGAAATTSAEGGAVHAETTSSAMPALPDSDRGIRADAGPQARSDASSIEPGRAACPAAGVGLLEVAALAEALPPIRPPPAAAIHAPAAPSTGSPSPPKPDPPRGHDSSLAPPAVSHTSKVSPPLLAQQQQQPATTSPSSPAHGSLGCLSPPDIPAATAAVHASLSQASAPPPQPSPGSPRLRCPVAVAPASNRDLPAALAAPSGAMTLNPHGTRRAPPRAPGPGAVRAAPVEHPSCTADGHRKVQPCGSITRPSGRGSPPGRRPPPGGDIRGPGQARLLSNETPASSASASLPPHEPPSESSSIAPTPRASAPPMPAPPSPTPPQLLASSLLTGSLASPGASSLGGSSSSALDTTAAASDSRASALASSLVTAPLLDLPASLLLADSAHAPDDPSATLSRQAAETKRGASGAAADSSTRGSRGAQERAVTDAGRAAVDAGALGLADLAVATTVAQPEKSPRRIMQQLAPRGENGLPGHGSMSSSALTAATEGPPLAASGLVASNEGAPGNCGRGMTGPEVSDADLEQSDALSLCLSEIKGLLDKRPHSLTKAAHTGLALRRFHGRVELFAGCSRVTGRFFCFVCLVMSWLTFFRLPGESGQMPLSFMAFFTHL